MLWQTIVTGAGDETLRFWNIFPSVKTPVCQSGPRVTCEYFLFHCDGARNIHLGPAKCLLFVVFQAAVKDTGLWSLGRTHIR